jgi:hypothetical protein
VLGLVEPTNQPTVGVMRWTWMPCKPIVNSRRAPVAGIWDEAPMHTQLRGQILASSSFTKKAEVNASGGRPSW